MPQEPRCCAVIQALLPAALCLAALLTVTTPGQAHVDLLTPVPREHGLSPEPNANLKQGPCGQEQNGRTERVNVFTPGATIAVTFKEFVNHRSYYRVAFDADSDDDFPLFPGPGVAPGGEPPSTYCPVDDRVILAYELGDGNGGTHTLEVTLPDFECDNCTLQVTQYMYDTARPYYFQCADLILRRSAVDAGALESDAGGDGSVVPVPAAAPPDFSSFKAAPSCTIRPPSAPDAGAGGSSSEGDVNMSSQTAQVPPNVGAPTGGAMPGAGARARRGGCTLLPVVWGDGGDATLVVALALGQAWRRRRKDSRDMTPRGE